MYKYIEIVNKKTDEIVSRIDVSQLSERKIDRCEFGMNINLNHLEYFTRIEESQEELEIING
jgi:hypothetical protein